MLFFSMELVEGNSLFQMQKKGHRFDWREILQIAKDVSKGLRHAHDRGIIHRDLKPGNLLMVADENGRPAGIKITDFGIAKRFGTSQNTGSNVLGTMDFMSPEQARGQPVTIRSDLYSLGSLLFTLLAGRPPFTANSVEESLRNLTRVPAPHIGKIVPEVPRDLDNLINKLMEKSPEKRIQTAQALLYQLEEIEAKLRDDSEAQTAQQPIPKMTLDDTFDVANPHTKENTSVLEKRKKPKVSAAAKATVEFTDHDVDQNSSPTGAKVDYFNTVTDHVRKKQLVDEPVHKTDKRGILIVTLALIVVFSLAGIGIYQAYKPRSAEELYAEIELGSDQPNMVLTEINDFLKNYPDEPRATQIAELKRVGEAIDLYNSLSSTLVLRSGLAGENRLTEIEKQFLGIVDLAESEPALADAKMSAFVTVHDHTDGLDPRDQKCVEAAKSYKIKLENDARIKVLFNLKQIRAAMNKASQNTEPESAIPIYESILKLYGDVEWGIIEESEEGRQLINKAQLMLDAMRAARDKQAEKEANQTAGETK